MKKSLMLLVVCIFLVLTALTAHAQDATATPEAVSSEATAQPVARMDTLFLLAGLVAVVIVGGVMYMREQGASSTS